MEPDGEEALREAVRKAPTPQAQPKEVQPEEYQEESGWKAELLEQECVFGLKRKLEVLKAQIQKAKAKQHSRKHPSAIPKLTHEAKRALHRPEAAGGNMTHLSEEDVRKEKAEKMKARIQAIRSAMKPLVQDLPSQTSCRFSF